MRLTTPAKSADKRWDRLFLFCLGLSIGVGFCLTWIAADLWVKDERFSMFGLELSYSKEKTFYILSHLDEHVKRVLSYHLQLDFVFMAGIFPGAACLCMMARTKLAAVSWRRFFFVLAAIQSIAWAGDVTENLYLLRWLRNLSIGDDFGLYRFIVTVKWIIGLLAPLFALPVLLTNIKRKTESHFLI